MELLVNKIKSYVPLSFEDEIVMRGLFHKKALKKGEHLLEAGNVCRYVIFIETGLVRYYMNKEGVEQTNYFNKENEFVCDYMSFLTQIPSYVNIQALEDTKLVTFTRKDLDQMLANPMLAYKIERFGRLVAEHYLCCYEDRMASFITQTPEERYMHLLNTGREILQRMPQHYIANFLGITPVSLSRIRRRVLVGTK